jgi:YD repeat-containing protein
MIVVYPNSKNYFKQFFSTLFFLTGMLVFSNAQNIIPPAPNAAGLAQAIDMPVGLYTGTQQVNIPIFTIEQGGLKIPISISYTPGGVRVADMASWCGLGWNLNAGGLITRSVVGYPDESDKGFLNVNIPETDSFDCEKMQYNITDTGYSSASCNVLYPKIAKGEKDGQPDQYHFSFPGASGRIVWDKNKQPKPVPQQNISFSGFGDWSASDGMGNSYIFSDNEESTTRIKSTNTNTGIIDWVATAQNGSITGQTIMTDTVFNAVSSWYLSQITAKNATNIEFIYDIVQLNYDLPSSSSQTQKVAGGWPQLLFNVNSTTQRQYVNTKRLNSIIFDQGKVRFIASAKGRADLIGDKALEKIIIENNKGEIIKQFVFNYDYMVGNTNPYTGALINGLLVPFDSVTIAPYENNYYDFIYGPAPTYTPSYMPSLNRRLLLKSITEPDKNGVALNKGTSFEYIHDKGLPLRNDSKTDHWGFYNRVSDTGQEIVTLPDGTIDFAPGIKEPNFIYTQQGSLYKVNYPTEGGTKYTFQSNYATFPAGTVYGGDGTQAKPAGGISLSAIVATDPVSPDSSIYKSFFYYNGASSAAPDYRNIFSSSDGDYVTLSSNSMYPLTTTQGSYVGYGRVEEFSTEWPYALADKGKTEYYFSNPTTNPDIIYPAQFYLFGLTTKVMSNPPVDNRDWQRGMLLQKNVYNGIPGTYDYILNQQVTNSYTMVLDTLSKGVQSNFLNIDISSSPGGTSASNFVLTPYRLFTGRAELSQTQETNYDDNGVGNSMWSYIEYNKRNFLPCYTSKSGGSLSEWGLSNYTTYGADFADYSNLPELSSLPVESIEFLHSQGEQKIIGGQLFNYNELGHLTGISKLQLDTPLTNLASFKFSNMPLAMQPLSFTDNPIANFLADTRYAKEVSFKPDSSVNGFLKEKETTSGIKETYIWGYNPWEYNQAHDRYPVAKIIGCDYNTAVGFISQAMLDSALYYTDAQIRSELNKLRINLPNAFVTTYTYAPLVGKTSETDPNGKIIFYEYDNFNRLKVIKDDQGNVLKTYQYNYKQ